MTRFRRLTVVVTILVFVVACTRQNDPHAGVETGKDNAAVDAVFASWDVSGSPGCALAVAEDGALVYSRGYGYANLDYDIPITPQTVFDVASVTKQFNAASLGMLALEGTLSLEDNVRKWLPELPEYEWPVTLRHMLDHSSGLRDYLTLFPLAGRNDYYPISHAQILAMMSRQRELNSPPGDQYSYSNTAYMLLSQVIERASGQSLGEITEERIFKPLGMEDSFMYENLERIVPRRATGYLLEDDGRVRIVHNYNFDVAGDGQLYSTMENLLLWDNYLHGDEEPAIHSLMLTERYLNNGDPIEDAQGIRRQEYRGLRTVGHGGSSWGFRTELVRFVEPGLSIAISCNMGDVNPQDLAKQVADHYLADQLGPESDQKERSSDEQVPDAAAESPSLTPDQLAEYVGAFFSPELDATYRFSTVDSRLMVRIEQEAPLVVVPVAEDRFEISFHPQGWGGPDTISLDFDRNRAGVISGFGLSLNSERGIVFERRGSR
jgi:CubicO group peptidase (beta-lactamase class C family)